MNKNNKKIERERYRDGFERNVEPNVDVHGLYIILFGWDEILFAFRGGNDIFKWSEIWLISGYVTDFQVSGINRCWYGIFIYINV